jgi:8-oxo-dGTP pyrophosphatase MutT (NUDIX family)
MKTSVLSIFELMDGNTPPWADDRVFWYAQKIIRTPDGIEIHVDKKKSLTAFNPVCQELQAPCISTLASLRPAADWNKGFGPVLVSSGTLLFINGKILVTRRSADATIDPWRWTTPAGRCDRTPVKTAYKETAEEVSIENSEGLLFLPEGAAEFKTKKDKENILFYPENHGPIRTEHINFIIDNKIIERHKMWSFYSPTFNTLELRLPLFATINDSISVSNPEYGTPTALREVHTLDGEPMVPALEAFQKNFSYLCGDGS